MFNEHACNLTTQCAEIDAFEYVLPSLLHQHGECRSVFSTTHQSLCALSDQGIVHELHLVNEFKWQTMPASAIRNNSLNPMTMLRNEKLCLLSNSGVETFDFMTRKWNKVGNGFLNLFNASSLMRKSSLQHSGIYHDLSSDVVFVGGGMEECKQRYFNLYKAKWYSLPDTVFGHKYLPLIWSSKSEPNVMYCGGNTNGNLGVVECYDIRCKADTWQIAEPRMQFQSYLELGDNARFR